MVKAFICHYFLYIYIWGEAGEGLGSVLYEAGLIVVYIRVFVPQNHLDSVYPLYKQNMYILIKWCSSATLSRAVKRIFVPQRQ